MLTLKNKIDQRKVKKDGHSDSRMSVRDMLLVKGMCIECCLYLYHIHYSMMLYGLIVRSNCYLFL